MGKVTSLHNALHQKLKIEKSKTAISFSSLPFFFVFGGG